MHHRDIHHIPQSRQRLCLNRLVTHPRSNVRRPREQCQRHVCDVRSPAQRSEALHARYARGVVHGRPASEPEHLLVDVLAREGGLVLPSQSPARVHQRIDHTVEGTAHCHHWMGGPFGVVQLCGAGGAKEVE